MNEIKPIETLYKGYRFRSRLEARWAVFLDFLDIKYEYEKEGYDLTNEIKILKQENVWKFNMDNLKSSFYLPDFWLPEKDFWFEIKGKINEESEIKAVALVQKTQKNVHIAIGEIPDPTNLFRWFNENEVWQTFIALPQDKGVSWSSSQVWCECEMCGNIDLGYCGYMDCLKCKQHQGPYINLVGSLHYKCGDNNSSYYSNKLKAAYTAARSARF